jgi:urea transport system ATP-binding protein
MLHLESITSYYGKTPILQGMTMHLEPGDFLGVIGRNGVGKTTLARTIMGLTSRCEGSMRLGNTDLLSLPTHLRAGCGIGYVPQGRGILGKLTVRENILLGTFARTDQKQELPPIVLELFPYLAENLGKRAGTLSGGQAQQLAIARALATNPRLLILDEPTEGIQPNIVEQIQELISRLNTELKISVLLIEQNVDFVQRAARHFMIMNKGTIEAAGPIADLTEELVHEHMTI